MKNIITEERYNEFLDFINLLAARFTEIYEAKVKAEIEICAKYGIELPSWRTLEGKDLHCVYWESSNLAIDLEVDESYRDTIYPTIKDKNYVSKYRCDDSEGTVGMMPTKLTQLFSDDWLQHFKNEYEEEILTSIQMKDDAKKQEDEETKRHEIQRLEYLRKRYDPANLSSEDLATYMRILKEITSESNGTS